MLLSYFSTLNSNILLEFLYHSQFLCDRIFQNAVLKVKVTGKPITVTGLYRGFQKVEVPIFRDNRHMKAIRLSALHTDRLYRHDIDVHQ
jgi:hypothetical protein